VDIVKEFISGVSWDLIIKTGLRVLLILFFAWLAIKVLHRLTQRLQAHLTMKSKEEGEPPSESEKRIETIVRLVRQATLLALWVTVGLVLLKEFGVEVGPIIASAGIVGLAVGFGAQNLVRDFISGFFIILENQIRVGDVAIINGTGGLVDKINFRTVVLRDLSGVVHVFPNGTINTLSNMTNEWSAYVFDLGVAYKENTDRVTEIIKEVGQGMIDDVEFGSLILEPPEIFGVDKFGDSAVVIKGRIKTRPIRQWMVGREFLRRIKLAFDEQNIEIPFPHRTFYFGDASKPVDLQIVESLHRQNDSPSSTGQQEGP
jgi:small conductance mechanosensitive channel